MTERPGGSDVSRTETTAVATSATSSFQLGTPYLLDGLKWFSSATDSDVSVALARTGPIQDGARSLSLFLVPLRQSLLPLPSASATTFAKPTPLANNIFVHRLKNKIGTHILPTAELSLEGATGYLVGELNQGVKNIAPVLNITRVWSAIGSTGALRKCLQIATSYAEVRTINGNNGPVLLKNLPLHVAALASISLTYRALAHFALSVARLLGRQECRTATSDEEKLLRLLTPTVKAFCAQLATGGMEEAMTTLGGAGYMEENAIGRNIRDGLVEKLVM
jgi:alkylation response protein AidB-like acyl-CoA dehydrogenase